MAPAPSCVPLLRDACGVRRRLAGTGLDLVCAADAIYVDQEVPGGGPSTSAFVRACALLCGPRTRVLVCFEVRLPRCGLGPAQDMSLLPVLSLLFT
jgi:hypothetical protein